MKIEKLSTNKITSKGVLIGFVICLIFVIIVSLLTSKAKYQNTESVKIVESKVKYKVPDLNAIAINLDNGKETVSSNTIPKSNYLFDETKSYCTVPNKEEPIKGNMKYNNGNVDISINTKGTKCYLYFNSVKNTTELIQSYGEVEEKTEFTEIATTDEGVYSAPDGMYGGTSYYYRGAVEDNYVHFAGFYWRIIRINGDGSLRLFYDGDKAYANGDTANGSKRQIGTKSYNTDYNDNKFVGFKYDDNNIHGTTTASTILGSDTDATSLYGWYKTNIADKGFDNKVDQNGMFCNDRNATTDISQTWDDWLKTKTDYGGTGSTATYYGANIRFVNKSTVTPTLNCENANDIFSKEGSIKGNKSLTYPIGLITVDEIIFAGGFYNKINSKYYLCTYQNYWAMSPSYFNSTSERAIVFSVSTDGKPDWHRVGLENIGVRPVINLKSDTPFSSGDGSYDSPFEVS